MTRPAALERTPDREPDPKFWRTELLAPGPYGDPPGHWTLWVDGQPIASTAAPLANSGAHDWARAQLGEGVRFEPVVFDDVAEQALREGRALDWCANSMPPGWRPARGSSGG